MPLPFRYLLALVDWCRAVSLRDFDLRIGSFQLDRDECGWGMDAPWGLFVSRGRIDDVEGHGGDQDGPESTHRVLCDHALHSLLVDAVERGRNGDDPAEAADLMLRDMELDEIEQNVEEGSER